MDERLNGGGTADPDPGRYYGPFGPSAVDPIPSSPGAYAGWSAPDGYQPPASPAPDSPWSSPATLPAEPAAARAPRRGLRAGPVIAIAAATALVIGGGAGYGGARLAQTTPAVGASAAGRTGATDPQSPDPVTTAAPVPPAPAVANTVAVAKRVLPGTVMIQVGRATGSGFVIDRQGRIITNNHVVADAADGSAIRVVFSSGRRVKATLVGRSPSYDIAVIKVPASAALHPLAIGDSDQSQVGESVIAVGSPLGLPGTVTQGIVSADNRPVVVNEGNADSPTAYIDAIQTDAPINPGNSGGPLVDSGARVIGVNSAILTLGESSGQSGSIGLGFAIPINQARTISRLLITKGKATYPVIGAKVEDDSGGVRLTSVDGNGPARRAGLREGDVVTKIDGHRVSAMEELIVTIRTRRPGQVVVLDYSRGSTKASARVTLGGKEG